MRPDFSYNVTKKVENYIIDNKMIGHGECVIIGLSGGADSVCLFLLLNKLKEKMGFRLYAAHINHGIRDLSAKRDEEFSRELCNKYNVSFVAFHVDVPDLANKTGLTIEEAGRNIRYECFDSYANKLIEDEKITKDKVIVAVAHHMNDQAETVLFNMVRGSGLKGVGGMSPVNHRQVINDINGSKEKLTVIRPLLCLNREEIEKYLEDSNQDYCTDETNLENEYSRNKIRNEIIPDFEAFQPKASEHIALLAKEASEAMEFIDSEVERLYSQAVDIEKDAESYKIRIKQVKDKSPILVRHLIILVLKQLVENYKDITRNHIEDIYELIYKGKGKYVMLPYNLVARREKEYLCIEKGDSNEKKEL